MDECSSSDELLPARKSRPCLVILLVSCGFLGLALYVGIRLFFVQTYTVPTNAMAPTLLGRHWVGVCPECGEPAFCSPAQLPVTATA